jgi:hypothetical protein
VENKFEQFMKNRLKVVADAMGPHIQPNPEEFRSSLMVMAKLLPIDPALKECAIIFLSKLNADELISIERLDCYMIDFIIYQAKKRMENNK